MNKQWLGLGLAALSAQSDWHVEIVRLAKDSSDTKTDLKFAIVTDTGGVDDKSFNQSAWEGHKLGVKKTVFLKITALLTSNLQVKQILANT